MYIALGKGDTFTEAYMHLYSARKSIQEEAVMPFTCNSVLLCPKCSANPITVIPILKLEFANELAPHYAYGALQPFYKSSKIPFASERL